MTWISGTRLRITDFDHIVLYSKYWLPVVVVEYLIFVRCWHLTSLNIKYSTAKKLTNYRYIIS